MTIESSSSVLYEFVTKDLLSSPTTQTISAVILLTLTLVYGYQKQQPKLFEYIPVNKRHELPNLPSQKPQIIELSRGELEYVRLQKEQDGGNKIFLVACLKGKKDPQLKQKLEKGASMCQRKHPMLRCRLIEDSNKKIFIQEDETLKIPIITRNRNEYSYSEYFTQEVEKRPLDVGNDAPSPHAIWIFEDEDSESYEIGFELAHFCIDGSALSPLLHDLLYYTFTKTYDLPSFGQWPIAQDVALENTLLSKLPNLLERKWRQLKTIWIPIRGAIMNEHRNVPRDDSLPVKDFGHLNSTLCISNTLTEEETKLFLQKCKAQGVSVTTAVTACYIEACAELVEGKTPFSATVSIDADSRSLCTPSIPTTDVCCHVWVFPSYIIKKQVWKDLPIESRWDIARDMRTKIVDYLKDTNASILYASLLGFLLSNQPGGSKQSPLLNVSSWYAKSPVYLQYDDGSVTVERVELLQNMAFHSWVNISIYTFVNRLCASVFAPVPRFRPELIEEVARRGSAKMREMLNMKI